MALVGALPGMRSASVDINSDARDDRCENRPKGKGDPQPGWIHPKEMAQTAQNAGRHRIRGGAGEPCRAYPLRRVGVHLALPPAWNRTGPALGGTATSQVAQCLHLMAADFISSRSKGQILPAVPTLARPVLVLAASCQRPDQADAIAFHRSGSQASALSRQRRQRGPFTGKTLVQAVRQSRRGK